jgi:hypothetical protein
MCILKKAYHFSYTRGTAINSVGLTIYSSLCKLVVTICGSPNVNCTGRRLTSSLEKSAICAVMCDMGKNETILMGSFTSSLTCYCTSMSVADAVVNYNGYLYSLYDCQNHVMLSCESITPLESPVVPLVNTMLQQIPGRCLATLFKITRSSISCPSCSA